MNQSFLTKLFISLSFFFCFAFITQNMSAQPASGYKFNGADQYVSIPSHSDFDILEGEALTISFWAKVGAVSTSKTVERLIARRYMSGGATGNTGYGVALYSPNYSNSFIADWARNGDYQFARNYGVSHSPNVWFHMAVVCDNSSRVLTLYKDGVVVLTSDPISAGDIISPSDVYVGAWISSPGGAPNGGEFFSGEMTDLRFYKRALSQSEIVADMTASVSAATPGLIAAYDFKNITQSGDDWIVADITSNHPAILHIFNLEGDGTEASPFQIFSAKQLAEVAKNVSSTTYNTAHYRLMNDIDLSAYQTGAGWAPIGTSTNSFKGVFDGNGKTISGLSINSTDAIAGLFGVMEGATSKIQNLRVIGNVTASHDHAGGIVGNAKSGNIDNCCFSGSVTNKKPSVGTSVTGGMAGGIVGLLGV